MLSQALQQLSDREKNLGKTAIKTSVMRERLGYGNDWYNSLKKGLLPTFISPSFSPSAASCMSSAVPMRPLCRSGMT